MLESFNALPAVGDRRFGAVSLGYDRITTIRSEMQALADFAALVMGTTTDALTTAALQNFVGAVQSALATADVEVLPTPETPRSAVVAWALATAAVKA